MPLLTIHWDALPEITTPTFELWEDAAYVESSIIPCTAGWLEYLVMEPKPEPDPD